MKTTTFYDIHFHAMDLSHANITAFINRFLKEGTGNLLQSILNIKTLWIILISLFTISVAAFFFFKEYFVIALSALLLLLIIIMIVFYYLPGSLISKVIFGFIKKRLNIANMVMKKNRARNLLSFMESSIKYDFLIVEHFLKTKEPVIISENNTLSIGDLKFNKIVLCPLVMDFGYKNLQNEYIFYNIPPQKPVTAQTRDLFRAIKTYYSNDIFHDNKSGVKRFSVAPTNKTKEEKLFEIYPFMGLNTKNYTLEETDRMLKKYFGDFDRKDSSEKRKTMLHEKMGEFDGNLDDDEACKNIFAGIKLYPPLGFEPWPDDIKDQNGENERQKVKLLYQTCMDKNIPVIAHCSSGGFLADKDYIAYSNPAKQWATALSNYPELKINFAHFGTGNKNWEKSIIAYILEGNNNIYTDFSCNTKKDIYYEELAETFIKHNKKELENKVLFGTDFMINLLWLESYNEYLKDFADTTHFTDKLKMKLVNENAERFLFG